MSEHWKSTPKYWCKHCSTYVKDTPFEKKQHEATGKHQGNLKRFLNGIQKDHARNEREKNQAKAEVDRLNRIAGASSSAEASNVVASFKATPRATKPSSAGLSVADQKRQWVQLAEMGIAVPEQTGPEVAAVGGWQKVSQRVVNEPAEPIDDKLNIGMRKRKFEGQEEEEEAGEALVRRGWGSTTRTYPDSASTPDGLDSLLAAPMFNKKRRKGIKDSGEEETKENIASSTNPESAIEDSDHKEDSGPAQLGQARPDEPDLSADLPIKSQPADEDVKSIRHADEAETSTPVFKKRRRKNSPRAGAT